jgi:hypothetical protein
MCGVRYLAFMKLSISGSSRSSAMPLVTRMAVFMQLKVVPMMAIATVTAIVTIRPKPSPWNTLSPISLAKSPMGAEEAAAAANPVTAVAPVPEVSLSLTMRPVAKYSNK